MIFFVSINLSAKGTNNFHPPRKDIKFEGFIYLGFEQREFTVANHDEIFWIIDLPDSLSQIYWEATSDMPEDERKFAVYVKANTDLSADGIHGHLGIYKREITLKEIYEVQIADYDFYKYIFNDKKKRPSWKAGIDVRNIMIKMLEDKYCRNHPLISDLYKENGYTEFRMKEYDSAIEYYNNALNIWKEMYGNSHEEIAKLYMKLGKCYNEKQDYDKALEIYNKAREVFSNIYADSNDKSDKNEDTLAQVYDEIGKIYNTKGDDEKAIEYFRKARRRYNSMTGDFFDNSKSSLRKIAKIQHDIGDLKSAVSNLKASRENAYNPTHSGLYYGGYNDYGSSRSLYKAGNFYLRDGEVDNALSTYKDALKKCEEDSFKNLLMIDKVYNGLAKCYLQMKQYDKALEHVEKALEYAKMQRNSEKIKNYTENFDNINKAIEQEQNSKE